MIPFLGPWACEERHAAFIADSLSRMSAADLVALSSAWNADGNTLDLPYSIANGVATIPLSGVLVKDSGWWLRYFGGTSTTEFAAAVRAADADPNVKILLIECDSPGGQVSGTPEAAESVDAANKPVAVLVTGMCCSGAYWIASQADHLYVRPESQSGNIGCYTYMTDLSKMHENAGIKVKVFRSGEHKGVGVGGTSTTDAQDAEIQRGVDGIASLFHKAVQSGRKMKAEKVDAVSDGRSFLGSEAVSVGLVDGVAGHDAMMSALQSYVLGRKAIHIAATCGTGENDMNLWDQFLEWKSSRSGDGDDKSASQNQASSVPAQVYLEGKVVADARIAQLESELVKERSQREVAQTAATQHQTQLADAATAANREAVQACFKAGKIDSTQIDAHCELRAKSPEVYDATMAVAKASPLIPESDKVDAASVSAQNDDKENVFLDSAAAYVKKHYAPTQAGGPN